MKLLLRFLSGFLAFLISSPVVACSCMEPTDIDYNYYDTRSIVFLGKVISIKYGTGYNNYEFEIIHAYKGCSGKRIRIRSGSGPASCGMSFSEGQVWLLDCWKEDGSVTTSSCALNLLNQHYGFKEDTAYFANYHKNRYVKFIAYRFFFEGLIKSGKPEGEWKFYERSLDGDGYFSLYLKGSFVRGKRDGTWIQYNLKDTAGYRYYNNGKPVGKWVYYVNKKPFRIDEWTEGLHLVTELEEARTYIYAYKHHKTKYVQVKDSTGKLLKQATYRPFKSIAYTEYYPNRVIKEKGHFTREHKYFCDTWFYYDEKGNLLKTEYFPKSGYNEGDNSPNALYELKIRAD